MKYLHYFCTDNVKPIFYVMLLHLDIFVYHSAYKQKKNTRTYFVC